MQGWMEIGDWLWVSGVAATGASVHATSCHAQPREGGSDGTREQPAGVDSDPEPNSEPRRWRRNQGPAPRVSRGVSTGWYDRAETETAAEVHGHHWPNNLPETGLSAVHLAAHSHSCVNGKTSHALFSTPRTIPWDSRVDVRRNQIPSDFITDRAYCSGPDDMIGSLDTILTQILFCLYHLAVRGSSHVTTATKISYYIRLTHQSLRHGLLHTRLTELTFPRPEWASSGDRPGNVTPLHL